MIEGIGWITSLEDVALGCANMSCMQLMIVDISASKPILYQFAWKLIKFIESKNKTWARNNKDAIMQLPMVFLGGGSTSFSSILLHSCRIPSTVTTLNSATTIWRSSTSPSWWRLHQRFFARWSSTLRIILFQRRSLHSPRAFSSSFPRKISRTCPVLTMPPNQRFTRSVLPWTKVENIKQMVKSLDWRGWRRSSQTRASRWAYFISKKELLQLRPFLTKSNWRTVLQSTQISAIAVINAPFSTNSVRAGNTSPTGRTLDEDKGTILKHMDKSGNAWLDL